MKNLFIVLCAAVSACDGGDDGTSSACGDGVIAAGEQCDDGNDTAADGCTGCVRDSNVATVVASWRFTELASNTNSGCPAGYDVVTLYMQPVEVSARLQRMDAIRPSGPPSLTAP